MGYKSPPPKLASYSFEDMEKMFHADSYEILGAKTVELARAEGQIAGEAIENPKRGRAAYNQVIAKYIFKEIGCSWREWKLDQLGEKPREEVKKPVRKMVPLNTKPTNEQMVNMVTPGGIKPKGNRPRIEF